MPGGMLCRCAASGRVKFLQNPAKLHEECIQGIPLKKKTKSSGEEMGQEGLRYAEMTSKRK